MLRNFFASAIAMAATFTSLSQEKDEQKSTAPQISGSVDFYYRFNLSNPKKENGFYNNYTSFTNSQNSFELGMASVKFAQTIGKTGFVADLGFGTRAEEFSYNDANSRFAIKQAYITYAPSEQITFTAGSWATHIGYEVLDPIANRNYSMSYLFSYGPFAHTGVKTNVQFGNNNLMIGIANPADLKSASFSNKAFIAQYSFVTEDEKFKTYLNFQKGRSNDSLKTQQLDLVTVTSLSDRFSIGFNGSLAHYKYRLNGKFDPTADWWGAALYLNYDSNKSLGFTLRGEYFDDEKSACGAAFGTSIVAQTLSANIKLAQLTIIPEIRFDQAGKGIFLNPNGDAIKSTASMLVAAVYQF